MTLASGIIHRLFEPPHLDLKQQLVVLGDEASVRDIEPDGMKALERFPYTLFSPEE
jgi:hypothetical protein